MEQYRLSEHDYTRTDDGEDSFGDQVQHDERLSVKELIERRYSNLKTDYRKPGMEYVQAHDVRDALAMVAPHRGDLLLLSDDELIEEYSKWYQSCKNAKKANPPSEMSLPDLCDDI
jgi:hypothetical protein